MSRLDELISELCPNGVEYKKIDDLAQISAGGDLPENYVKGQTTPTEKYPYPIYSNGTADGALYGYTDSYKIEEEAITISARGTIGHHQIRRGKFTPIVRLITLVADKSIITTKFLNYALCVAGIEGVTTGIPSLTVPMLKKFAVPVPPLPVQGEIVRILDNFTELAAELTAELQKRREQYRHYSTMLFDDAKKSGVHSIEEICHIEKGKTPIQKAIPGIYPMVVTTTERKSCDTYQFDAKAVCIPLVSSRGHGVASLNHVYYQEGKFALGNILCAIIPKNEEQVYPKYLYYYFEQTKDYTLVPLMKGGANVSLHMNDIRKVKVPIPSLEEQKRIVDILGRFDTLCNDISTGLPAEIEARQKQYEYYRDRLLTFQKIS